ncbi:Scr1 family TA system antitoxin-like transcriptional regulator [Streptomyces sp. NPDC005918]|uniref:Scr1 family TA system antitoxin-like transcriptional regulator n=1 Tax=Streptomyces sp. NPDC005918 TaxID=3155454 RepID=UPI0033C36CF3
MSTHDTPAPFDIVLGSYLRARRKALYWTLHRATLAAPVSRATIHRWELAHAPISTAGLEGLLKSYGAPPQEIRYLQTHVAARQARRRLNHRRRHSGAWDTWVDAAGKEAMARYTLMARRASDVIQYTAMRIPPDYRTPAYRTAITNPSRCPDPDEPADAPWWLRTVDHAADQHRTLLLDESVLKRPIGGPAVMAQQLQHLLQLMDDPAPATIRVLPATYVSAISLYSEIASFTVNGHPLIAGMHIAPWYETSCSPTGRAAHDALRLAVDYGGRQESYDLLSDAADHWARSPEPRP